jgi:hypothetical protein
MPVHAPIKLTFYDPETFDATAEFICNFIPVRFLKLAIRLARSKVNINKDTLEGLIVDLFENKFSVDALRSGSEESDRMQVLQDIMTRANSFTSEGSSKSAGSESENPDEAEDEARLEDLEITLVKSFGWSLHDIDHTDIESLFPFVSRFAGTAGKVNVQRKVYCDQAAWL